MEQFENRMGIFPALIEPAREAARKLLRENVDAVELEGKPGFLVVPKGTIASDRVFHEFECDGVLFSLIEKEEME